MAVTFDANATSDVTANAVTSITTSNLTVGSGTNRALIAQIVLSGTVTALAMNWDQLGTPQAMAAITGAAATNTGRVELWGLVAPTSGAKQLSVTWTTSRDVYVNQLSYTVVDQTGGATSFPHGASATGTTAGPTSVTVTSAVNNAVVAAHFSAGSFVSVNNTQTFLDNVAANASGAGNRAAGAATVTMTGTMDGAVHAWIAVGTDIAAASTGAPFSQGDYPNPVAFSTARKFPSDLRTFLGASNFKLAGKDQFFGPAGMGPDYDWPNPRGKPYPIDLRTFTASFTLGLIGKDVFFGPAGMGPDYDFPNPRGKAWLEGRTWLQNLLQSTLGIIPLPFVPPDFPNPRAARAADRFTWTVSLNLDLLGQDVFFGAPGQVPAQLDWPVPKGRLYPADLRTFTNPLKINLIAQDAFFGAAGQPPTQGDWPVPKARLFPSELRTFLESLGVNLLGQDTFFAGAGRGPAYDFPNPIPRRQPDLQTYVQSLLLTTLGLVFTPFALLDWPNPIPIRRANLYQPIDNRLAGLLAGLDQFFGAPGQPLQPPMAPVPPGRLAVIDLKTHTINLLENTLGFGAGISGGHHNRLILVEGRLAIQLRGMIYVFVE